MPNRTDIVRAARHAFVDTVDGLTDADFDHGTAEALGLWLGGRNISDVEID